MDLRVFFCWVNLRQSRGEKRVLRENFLKKMKKRKGFRGRYAATGRRRGSMASIDPYSAGQSRV